MGRLLDILFPSGEPQRRRSTSELIRRGLEALRAARDERALDTGAATVVPSRLELRLPQVRYDELAEIGALRDVEFHFNDELMKELSARRLRTFGDAPMYVTIGVDTSLQPNEIYATALAPTDANTGVPSAAITGHDVYDRTAVLDNDGSIVGRANAAQPIVSYRLVVGVSGSVREVPLAGSRWVVGRRGSSGRRLPDGCVKIDLDLPPSVSREQLRIDLVGGDRLRIERIGKAAVSLEGEPIAEGESRLAPLGASFAIEECELAVKAYAS